MSQSLTYRYTVVPITDLPVQSYHGQGVVLIVIPVNGDRVVPVNGDKVVPVVVTVVPVVVRVVPVDGKGLSSGWLRLSQLMVRVVPVAVRVVPVDG